jgi:hypothetical protein
MVFLRQSAPTCWPAAPRDASGVEPALPDRNPDPLTGQVVHIALTPLNIAVPTPT